MVWIFIGAGFGAALIVRRVLLRFRSDLDPMGLTPEKKFWYIFSMTSKNR